MEALKKATHFLNVVLVWIASFFLGAMIFLTCGNIFLRAVWLPLRGTFELMGYFGAIGRSHIAVDILVLRFSKKTRKILNGVNYLICTVFFSIVAWQIAKHATTLWKTGEVTETLRFAYYPFTYGVSLGCLVLALVMFVDFLQLLIGDKGEK
ncbi:MAG: TRAP transporter small permease subunit [Deltaproteobacteria bacterium]|nr:TRAP transporter small permease subunit [Deltaproteobacteria bacterium]